MSRTPRFRGTDFLTGACLALAVLLAGGWASAEESEAVRKIRAELAKPTEFAFQETPLSDAITFVKDLHDINVVLNRRVMEDAGITPEDTLITRSLKGVSLKSALNLTLADVGLTYVIENEVLLITTVEDAKANSMPRVYDVSALDLKDEDAEALIEVVKLVLDAEPPPKPRAIEAGPVAPKRSSRVHVLRGRLVVRASQPEQDRVEELLKRLNQGGKPDGPKGQGR